MSLISSLTSLFDPFGLQRKYIFFPLMAMTTKLFNIFSGKTRDTVLSARETAIRIILLLFTLSVIIWIAVFLYIAFYYIYMPTMAHVRPVHMQFEPCKDPTGGICSFPLAHVCLTKHQQLLMLGQPYKVIIHIDMPESMENQNLGLFMVCAEMRDQQSQLRDHSCRTAMLYYQSPLISMMKTLLMSPLYVFGLREEKQEVAVELFSNYEDDQGHPVTDVYIEIQSKKIQFYSVTLFITAHFTGLRYVMFYWPIVSSAIGISINLFFIITITLLSWYHWGDNINDEDELENASMSRERLNTDEFDSTKNLLLDDEDISVLDSTSKSIDDIEELIGDVDLDDVSNERMQTSNLYSRDVGIGVDT